MAEPRPGAAAADEREVEAKFTVTDPEAVQELAALDVLSDALWLHHDRLVEISDTYYDTPDYGLLRSGVVLRVRQTQDGRLVTLKGLKRFGLGVIHDRLEIEAPIPTGAPRLDPTAWPAGIRQRVVQSAGERPDLAPVAMLEQSRYFRQVFRGARPHSEAHAAGAGSAPGAGEAPLAELTIERVTVFDPDRTGVRRGEPELAARFAELEVELLPGGGIGDLREVAELLARRGDLEPSGQSKFERALRMCASHPPGHGVGVQGVQPGMTMQEAGRLVWRQQLTEILINEAGARRGEDIEYVHDMRVATRRARAAFELFGSGYRKSAVKGFEKALKRTGRSLGPVRDLDVALLKLQRRRAEAAVEELDEMDALAREWQLARSAAYEELGAWLDSPEYRRFIARFSDFCSTPGQGVREPKVRKRSAPTPTQVRHVMPVEVLRRYSAARTYETLFEDLEHVAYETMHALRIDCKRLRYSLEPLRHLLGTDAEALIEQLKGLQDHLGDMNDAVAARERLQVMLSDEAADPAAGAAVERQLEHQEQTIRDLRATFPEVWDAFVSPGTRQRLMLALARL
jgi:CHAD domain-containing protein